MRRLGLIFGVLICGLVISLGISFWPTIEQRLIQKSVTRNKSQRSAKDGRFINDGKYEEAKAIIKDYGSEIENFTESGKKWTDLLVKASEMTNDRPQLVILYEHSPKAFEHHEKASLMVADSFIASGKSKDYQALRVQWKGREKYPDRWFMLDSDKLLLEGKRTEAMTFLKSQTFEGPADTGRLVRLALLNIADNPKLAWDYLAQAYIKDPQNPEIRLYRAKLLEVIGKTSLAQAEYIAAVQTAPNNIFLKDQLAEFFLRHKEYPQALAVFAQALKGNSMDFLWLKAYFWNRVLTPIKFEWSHQAIPQGKLQPLIRYLVSLKPGQFWDSKAFEKIPDSGNYLTSVQATFWLRLLEDLKKGDEKDALDLLKYNPFFSASWNPQLEIALKRILMYRSSGTLNITSLSHDLISTPIREPDDEQKKNETPFFTRLKELSKEGNADQPQKISSDLHELLMSKDAFAAAFLSAHWFEAALQLNTLKIIPAEFPEWFSYELAQAIRTNRGNEQALEFVKMQKPTPQLSLVNAELLIAQGSQDAALEILKKLYRENSNVGLSLPGC